MSFIYVIGYLVDKEKIANYILGGFCCWHDDFCIVLGLLPLH